MVEFVSMPLNDLLVMREMIHSAIDHYDGALTATTGASNTQAMRESSSASNTQTTLGSSTVSDSSVNQAMPSSGFKFSAASKKEMIGVRPELIAVAERALQLSTQDFIFYDGLRTAKEQAALKAAGQSQTLQSKHLTGDAMDLVPYINGGPKWDWEGCYRIALAVDDAATQLGYAHKIRWGGAWDRTLADFGGSTDAYRKEVNAYANRHPGKDFLDGVHYEWVS